jgi:hypothetical protein
MTAKNYTLFLEVVTGFPIEMTDYVGQVETDLIPFSESWVLIWMVISLALHPDGLIGIDTTITCNKPGEAESSMETFASLYKPFTNPPHKPSILLIAPLSGSSVDGPSSVTSYTPEFSCITKSSRGIMTISIGPNIYNVLSVLFKSQTLIRRTTNYQIID